LKRKGGQAMTSPVPNGMLKNYRLSIGATQKALAKVANVSTETYARWERGQSFPSNLEKRRQIYFWLKNWLGGFYQIQTNTELEPDAWCIAPNCLAEEIIEQFARYELDPDQAAKMFCHLIICKKCAEFFHLARNEHILSLVKNMAK